MNDENLVINVNVRHRLERDNRCNVCPFFSYKTVHSLYPRQNSILKIEQ